MQVTMSLPLGNISVCILYTEDLKVKKKDDFAFGKVAFRMFSLRLFVSLL